MEVEYTGGALTLNLLHSEGLHLLRLAICRISLGSYWRAIKAAANELHRINLPQLNANFQSCHVDV